MPQQLEPHHRASDQSTAARIAYSPYAALAHLATTGILALALASAAATFYSQHRANIEQTDRNTATAADIQSNVSKLSDRLSSVQSRAQSNTQAIERVEQQAMEDRQQILKRIESIDRAIRDLNAYLRKKSGASLMCYDRTFIAQAEPSG